MVIGLVDLWKTSSNVETQLIKNKIVAAAPISVDEAKRMNDTLNSEKTRSQG